MNRPALVTALGVLAIGLGVWGILDAPFSLAGLWHLPETAQPDAPAASGVALAWMYVSLVLKVVGAAALITAGAGLLKLKPWARILTLAWAGYAIFLALIGALIMYAYIAKPTVAAASGSTVVATGMIARVGFSLFSGTLLPIVLIVFMCRERVIEALNQESNASETFAGQPGRKTGGRH